MKNTRNVKLILAVFSILMIILTACSPEELQSLTSATGDRDISVQDETCVESLNAVTVDDLIIPAGTTCTLTGTRVEGYISVMENASLFANGMSVDGNIQAEYSAEIIIRADSYVGGNIQVKESGSLLIETTKIDGNLEASDNYGEQIYTKNIIQGNIQAYNNMGGVSIQDNTIMGDLECEGNDPKPRYSGNVVNGDQEGQCYDMGEMDEIDDHGRPYIGYDYQCTGTLNAVMVDDLEVPMNATCTLNQTEVQGNISIHQGATLYAYGVMVQGDIEAEYAQRVEIHPGSYVGGDLEFKESGSLIVSSVDIMGDLEVDKSYGEITIIDSTIKDDVEFEENKGEITIENNTIEGDVQFEENTGGLTIIDNTIYGDLECEENYPEPYYSGNTVRGDREGQCYMDEMEDNDDNDDGYDNDNDSDENGFMYLGDDYECSRSYDNVRADDLYVPMGATCTLTNAKIEGDLSVMEEATLIAYNVTIGGNLQTDYAAKVEIRQGSYVGGNIQFEEGGVLIVADVQVGGNLEASYSWGKHSYTGNTIGGDIQIEENTGGVTINNNIVYGDLECEDNYPAPTGSGNTVYGDQEGQCTW
jgi:hypothetical protein